MPSIYLNRQRKCAVKYNFTDSAKRELDVLSGAINEILDLSLAAFISNDPNTALQVEPLEQIIDGLKEQLRTRHINRLQRGRMFH